MKHPSNKDTPGQVAPSAPSPLLTPSLRQALTGHVLRSAGARHPLQPRPLPLSPWPFVLGTDPATLPYSPPSHWPCL